MIGSVQPPGRIENWDFVDGVPDEAPSVVGSHVRRRRRDAYGPDVGQYTSIAATKADGRSGRRVTTLVTERRAEVRQLRCDPLARAHRRQGRRLAGDRWATTSAPGRRSPSIDSMGLSGHLVLGARVHRSTQSGMPEGQLRYAHANTPDPQSSTDWTITVVDSRPLPATTATDGDAGAPVTLLPDSIAIMTAMTFDSQERRLAGDRVLRPRARKSPPCAAGHRRELHHQHPRRRARQWHRHGRRRTVPGACSFDLKRHGVGVVRRRDARQLVVRRHADEDAGRGRRRLSSRRRNDERRAALARLSPRRRQLVDPVGGWVAR